ncbi:MAG: hypothetical protein AMJ73_00300 [candidate division Zixibacteria bacterium SM1_73]|nr:MAG: hypothetical protein AMJ73_00300 [candidate division Zixibacteria bacterium SM1_73]
MFSIVYLKQVVALLVVGFVAWIVIALTVRSQCPCEQEYAFTGEAMLDRFGYSVSGAGDANDEDFDDLIVGAPFNDAPGTEAKRTYVHPNRLVICGDCNGDDVVNSVDLVCLLQYLFVGGPPPDPLCQGDANCDGVVDNADVVYLDNYLFRGGPFPCSECCDKKPSWKPPKAPGDLKRIE